MVFQWHHHEIYCIFKHQKSEKPHKCRSGEMVDQEGWVLHRLLKQKYFWNVFFVFRSKNQCCVGLSSLFVLIPQMEQRVKVNGSINSHLITVILKVKYCLTGAWKIVFPHVLCHRVKMSQLRLINPSFFVFNCCQAYECIFHLCWNALFYYRLTWLDNKQYQGTTSVWICVKKLKK